MYIHFKIIGSLLTVIALIHIGFPKYFNWNNDLKSLSLINRQMMMTHTFFIALTVFLMGILCLIKPLELTQTSLGKTLTFAFGGFWLIRLYFQIFIYSPKLWKGKTFETLMHIIFTIFWVYLTIIFFYYSFKS